MSGSFKEAFQRGLATSDDQRVLFASLTPMPSHFVCLSDLHHGYDRSCLSDPSIHDHGGGTQNVLGLDGLTPFTYCVRV